MPFLLYRSLPRRPRPSLSPFLTACRSLAMASSTSRREQPPWSPPPTSSASLPPLKIYNSLTKNKEPFVPIDHRGRKVTWYCCGPTVYDAGHLGHARNYVTTDVLRRILRDYFGFDVEFVQNVTDVDDKIILRARQKHLLDEFVVGNPQITPEIVATVEKAWNAYLTKNVTEVSVAPSDFQQWVGKEHKDLMDLLAKEEARKANTAAQEQEEDIVLDEKSTKLKMHLNTLLTASGAISGASGISAEGFYAATSSVLLPYLDVLHKNRDFPPEVFAKLSSYWERHFNEDMTTLNVLPPTVTTRVSEFIPENVAFVEKLVQKGFAYPTANGSVYFDIGRYESTGHHYAKLQPWNRGNEGLIADGEGALTEEASTLPNTSENKPSLPKEKKSKHDFALWKSSKEGEPSWDSPWGKGRPGWHIECSVMCSEVLGGQIDIHSGGIDLAFPHHDNEIAQSEAYWDGCCEGAHPGADGKHQWINYFLHMGHLHIHGSKMSKSLKNFVSIRDALQRGDWTSRRLRIVFLLGGWKEGIEVREGVVAEARTWETTLSKFFTNVKGLVAEEEAYEASGAVSAHPWGEQERVLAKALFTARENMHEALCDSFNTPAAMKVLADLIGETNKYLASTDSLALVKEVARWITRIVTIFGLDATSTPSGADRIGWSDTVSDGTSASSAEETALPYIRLLSSFRDKVRATAIANPGDVSSKAILAQCDRLRDIELADLGVSLDDRDSADGKPALVKFVPAVELRAAREEKEAKAAEKERRKEEARLKREEEDRERAEAAKLSHKEMFKVGEEAEKWSAWDACGIPTMDKNGEEVAKSKKKTLAKAWERQKKAHEAWLKTQQ